MHRDVQPHVLGGDGDALGLGTEADLIAAPYIFGEGDVSWCSARRPSSAISRNRTDSSPAARAIVAARECAFETAAASTLSSSSRRWVSVSDHSTPSTVTPLRPPHWSMKRARAWKSRNLSCTTHSAACRTGRTVPSCAHGLQLRVPMGATADQVVGEGAMSFSCSTTVVKPCTRNVVCSSAACLSLPSTPSRMRRVARSGGNEACACPTTVICMAWPLSTIEPRVVKIPACETGSGGMALWMTRSEQE